MKKAFGHCYSKHDTTYLKYSNKTQIDNNDTALGKQEHFLGVHGKVRVRYSLEKGTLTKITLNYLSKAFSHFKVYNTSTASLCFIAGITGPLSANRCAIMLVRATFTS